MYNKIKTSSNKINNIYVKLPKILSKNAFTKQGIYKIIFMIKLLTFERLGIFFRIADIINIKTAKISILIINRWDDINENRNTIPKIRAIRPHPDNKNKSQFVKYLPNG